MGSPCEWLCSLPVQPARRRAVLRMVLSRRCRIQVWRRAARATPVQCTIRPGGLAMATADRWLFVWDGHHECLVLMPGQWLGLSRSGVTAGRRSQAKVLLNADLRTCTLTSAYGRLVALAVFPAPIREQPWMFSRCPPNG